MIIVLKPGISKKHESAVLIEMRKRGYRPHVMRGVARTVIGASQRACPIALDRCACRQRQPQSRRKRGSERRAGQLR